MCAGGIRLSGTGKLLQEICEGLCGNSEPMTNLTKKDRDFTWGPEEEAAFQKLKEALTSAPVLQVFDEDKPHEVWVDASDYAVGTTLV